MITRIRELLEIRQLSPTQFADLIGVGRPVISHILSERNKPSLEVVQKVINAFPDVSLPWLLSGTGPMLTTTAPVAPSALAAEPVAALVAPPPTVVTGLPAPTAPREQPVVTTSASSRVVPAEARSLPPKFRPSAKAVPHSAPALEPISAYVAPTPAIALAPAYPPPTAVAAPALPALSEPQAPLYSAAAENPPVETNAPTSASYPTPIAPAAPLPALPSNSPAAALSFLGEPGRAIRRIVIFYHDGSFSDYQPEGQ